MEVKSHKVVRSFLFSEERESTLNFADNLVRDGNLSNPHIREVFEKLNGSSFMFDISRSAQSSYVANYQSDGNVLPEVPDFLVRISHRISSALEIPHQNVFLQLIDMQSGGTIVPHYDSTYPDHINYKCNISVKSEIYDLCVGDSHMEIRERDLYSFEASLYKHWTPAPFSSRRVLLSYGFILTYEELGRNEKDPRVRLGKRIEKYFQDI